MDIISTATIKFALLQIYESFFNNPFILPYKTSLSITSKTDGNINIVTCTKELLYKSQIKKIKKITSSSCL